jgi:multiple sugar transport system substrate-binding protein
MPAGPAGRVTGVNSAGFVIAKDSPNPEAAWEFVKFATGEAGQPLAAQTGLAIPIRESVAASPAYLEQAAKINHQMFVDALAYARVKPVFRGYEEWSGAVGDNLQMIWDGQSDVADAVAEAVAAGDEALARNQ